VEHLSGLREMHQYIFQKSFLENEAGFCLSIMTITAKFFASFQDIIGANSLKLSLEHDVDSIAELIEELERQYPDFGGKLEKFSLVAVNEQYSHRRYELADGDVVAFFPPVSGG
jgi:molybdopterin synthase sulfur carrier subunit